MTAKSFFKRYSVRILGLIACVFTCGVCTYADCLHNAMVVYGDKNLYFLVAERENVEVGAHFAEQQGGAGQVFLHGNRSYAVLSVNMGVTAGEQAQTSVSETGEPASLLEIPVGDMYFKTQAQKQKAPLVVGALEVLYQNIEILEQTVSVLDNGCTQESCKRLLAVSENQLEYLANEYKIKYPSFANVCAERAEALRRYQKEIVQSKALRSELYELCMGYLELRKEFSL